MTFLGKNISIFLVIDHDFQIFSFFSKNFHIFAVMSL